MYPDDLSYTSEHEWVRTPGEHEGAVRIGITQYAQDALGDIVYVSLPEIGESLEAGSTCGELESTKSVSDIYAPLSGEVVAVWPTLRLGESSRTRCGNSASNAALRRTSASYSGSLISGASSAW